MWVAAHELVVDGRRDERKIEIAALLGHAGVKHHLKQEIAELIPQGNYVVAFDRVGNLVGLFNRVRSDAAKVLCKIPAAPRKRIAQTRHDTKKGGQRRFGAAHGRASPVQSRYKVISMPAVAPQILCAPKGMSHSSNSAAPSARRRRRFRWLAGSKT